MTIGTRYKGKNWKTFKVREMTRLDWKMWSIGTI